MRYLSAMMIFAVLLITGCSIGHRNPEIRYFAPPIRYVNDLAQVLSQETKDKIAEAGHIEANTEGILIAIQTTPSTAPLTLEQYGRETAARLGFVQNPGAVVILDIEQRAFGVTMAHDLQRINDAEEFNARMSDYLSQGDFDSAALYAVMDLKASLYRRQNL